MAKIKQKTKKEIFNTDKYDDFITDKSEIKMRLNNIMDSDEMMSPGDILESDVFNTRKYKDVIVEPDKIKSHLNSIMSSSENDTDNTKNTIGTENQKKDNNLLHKGGYLFNRTASGVAGGTVGIAQAAITDMADNIQKGKSKNKVEAVADVAKSIFNPIGSILSNVQDINSKIGNIVADKDKSLLEKVVGVSTTATSGALDTIAAPINKTTQAIGSFNSNIDENSLLKVNDLISKPVEDWKMKLAEEGQNYGGVTNTLGDVLETVGNMTPSIAVNGLTGNPAASLATMGISAKGQSTREAMNRGAELEEAVRIGDTKAMIEVGTELLTGGLNIFGKGALDDIGQGLVNKVNNNVARFFAKQGVDVAGETLEETISDILDTAIDKGTVDSEANYSIKDWGKTALETTLSTLVLNVLTGGLINDVRQMRNEPTAFKDKITEDNIKPVYTITTEQDGEQTIKQVFGVKIENPNKLLNVSPAIVKNSNTNNYNVIDENTGIFLDTAPYESLIEAEESFMHKIINLNEKQIQTVNKQVGMQEAELNNQLMTELERIENRISNATQINENENLDDFNNETENYTQNRLDNFKSYFNENETYTIDDIANIWQNLDETELPVILDNDGNIESHIVLDENNDNVVVNKIDQNSEIIDSEEIPQTNGLYTATDIQNTIEKVFNNAEGAQAENIVENSDTIKNFDNATENEIIPTGKESDFYSNNHYKVKDIDETTNRFKNNKSYNEEELGDLLDDFNLEDNFTTFDSEGNPESVINLSIDDDGDLIIGTVDYDNYYDGNYEDYTEAITIPKNKKGKFSGKEINNAIRELTRDTSNTQIKGQLDIEGNEIKSMKINKGTSNINNGGNENVRFENNGQEINREQERKNTRGNKEIARFNRVVQNKQSKGLQNYEKQRILKNGEDFKATIAPKENYTKHENAVLKGFKEATGLDINVYETNKSTTEGAFYSDDGIFLKHNSLANEKSTNFKPYHEFGHWLEEHNKQEWQKVYNIIDDTITKNQIEDYKKVLNDKSRFDNMTEIEVREEIIKEITSDYFGNWANDIQNWIPYIKQGLISQEYQNFLANITLKNEVVGYNVFGSQEQQDAVYNQISQIMEDVIGKNNISKESSNSKVKYSSRQEIKNNSTVAQNLGDSIDKLLKSEYDTKNEILLRDSTPQILVNYGVNDLPMYINPSHLISNLISKTKAQKMGIYNKDGHYHNLGKETFIKVMEAIDNPVAILKSISKTGSKNSVVIITDVIDKKGEHIIVPVYINGKATYNNVRIDTNKIKTIYGKKDIRDFVDRTVKEDYTNLIYLTKDKNKRQFINGLGLQLSNSINNASINNSIPQNKTNVNTSKNTVNNSNTQKKKNNTKNIQFSDRTDTNENGEGGFYSQLENLIEEKMPKYANAQQIKNIINSGGVKADELAWIGLDDYLKQHSLEKLSKQDVLDYIKANQIEIETVEKGDSKIRELAQPIKDDIADKETEIKKYLDKYSIDYEEDNVTRVYRLDGTMIGTVGDYMAENLEKLVDLGNYPVQNVDGINRYENKITFSDDYTADTYFTEQELKEDMQELADLYDQLFEDYNNLSEIQGDYTDESIKESPKYKQYSLKGGENYQELLFTLPYLDSENKKQINKLNDEIAQLREKSFIPDPVMATEEQRLEANKIYAEINKKILKIEELEKLDITNYKSPHWDEKNVLAHARTQDFEDINGNKVLFIDEIQSDMHQQGRKKGYTSKEQQQRIYKLNQEISDRQEEQRIIRTTYTESQEQRERNSKRYIEIADELDGLLAERADLENNGQVSDIFPFKKNWHEFVLRRMINNAVLQGYDKVAWTSGKQQNARYNLSQAMDEIRYNKTYGKNMTKITALKNGEILTQQAIKNEDLADYIGKDLSLQILNSKENKGVINNLSTEILGSGNNGMSGFYDNIIPKFLDKYLKKWDSKVETVTLKDADGKAESEQMGFTVTDKMKQSVKEQGQPLFVDRNDLDDNSNIRFAKKIPKLEDGTTNAERADSWIEQEIQKIEKTGKWDDSIPATSRTDIRKTIEDYLGLGIKKGHFRQSAYGIYKGRRDVIRTKEYKDMDTILHETGHALDLGNRLKIDKNSIAKELLTAVNRLGGYENESRTVKLDEGFAEVIREYAIIPEQAKQEFPQSVAVIEKIRRSDESFDNFMKKVQEQTYNYIHQNPQNRVHSNISIGEQTDKTPLTKAWVKQEIMRNIYDSDYTVKEVVKELANSKGKTENQLKASENAYYLTRLASGVSDKVTAMLADGYIDTDGNKIMPGLNQIGEILGDDAQRYNDLRDYLVAKRDTDYKAKTLKTGIRNMDTKYVLNKFKNDKQIQQAAQVIYDTLDGVMKYAQMNGLISEEEIDSLKESNAFYVPMQRVIEGMGNQTGKKGAVSDIIKKRTGSELDIKDVLENIVANSSNIIQQVENNNVLKALYSQGEKAGLTGSIYDVISAPMMKVGTANLKMWEKELQKQGVNIKDLDLDKTIDLFAPNNKVDTKNLITSFMNEDGSRVYLQFNDEMLFNSLMNMDTKFMSQVLKINSKLNMPLRYGATMANIGFSIPNMISDTAQAAIYSNAGFIPMVDNALGVLDVLTATNKTIKKFVKQYSPEYVEKIENMYNIYKQTGATSSTRLSQYRDSTQNTMKDIYGTKNFETLGIEEKYKPLKRLLDIMTYIPEISEQSTRFRVFEKNYDLYKEKGSSEMDARILAALESRDATQDFGRTGNLTREINQLIPFSAARVGSAYTFAEKVKANPTQTGMRIALLTTLAMAVKAIGYDDDEIEELTQRKKDDNFVLKIGNNVVTIKKPQGILRSMINLAEYIQDLATGHIEEGKEGERMGEWLNNAIMDNMPADSVTGLVPNMVAPLIENAINKDLYYNTDIVKSYDLELPDSEQYYDYNSQLAILLGKAFNYSPAKIDNLISGYFAGLGTQVTNAMDYVSGQLGLSTQKAEMGAEENTIGKRFVVNVNSNSQSLNDIYDRKTELTKKKNGGTITSEEETELDTITSTISSISKLNKQIKAIKQSDLSGKEKAEQIKELQKQRTDLARSGLGKDSIYEGTTEKNKLLEFYPSQSTLSQNKNKLELTDEMKSEYANLAYEYYNKYAKQGLYNNEKLDKIKSKAKTYAKEQLYKKYKSQVIKNK